MGLRQRLRYRFDNLMARGVGSQILLLAIVSTLLVVLTAIAVVLLDVVPADDQGAQDSFGRVLWKSLMHMLDAGNIGGDAPGWTYLFVMLFITISGLFVLSALIGVLNQGFGALLQSLRRGKSPVIEEGHTVILGWTPKIPTLLAELAEAGANQRRACAVILADRDKVSMDAEVAAIIRKTRLRVVTRTGNPMSPADLALVSLPTSKAVIALAPETHPSGAPLAAHESDTIVLKTLLAIAKAAPGGRCTSWPRSTTSAPRRWRAWSPASGPGSCWPRRSSAACSCRRGASPDSRSSTPSCSTSPATRSTWWPSPGSWA